MEEPLVRHKPTPHRDALKTLIDELRRKGKIVAAPKKEPAPKTGATGAPS